jgi:hypothetical protein
MVFQNKEPLQFLIVFKGQYIVHKVIYITIFTVRHKSPTEYSLQHNTHIHTHNLFFFFFNLIFVLFLKGTRDDKPDKCVMYHIRGTDYLPLHAIQCNSVV